MSTTRDKDGVLRRSGGNGTPNKGGGQYAVDPKAAPAGFDLDTPPDVESRPRMRFKCISCGDTKTVPLYSSASCRHCEMPMIEDRLTGIRRPDDQDRVDDESVSDFFDYYAQAASYEGYSFDDHGNYELDGTEWVAIEAPNHSEVKLSGMETYGNIGSLKNDVIKRLREFDPDEEFEALWSTEFGEHNGFTPRQFLRMLEEDEKHFEQLAKVFEKY